ncbi:MAG: oligosaccharide flippase family protein [Dehalococcoidales bacterium]|jgi:O-antigen/teichoic acid export membrane protein|nr:oligosaccharide flippase family protein [Dehalococcoidales bacterium]
MSLKDRRLYKIFNELRATVTSKDRMKEVIRVPLYSNALFLMGASVFSSLIGFVFWLVAARFYPDEAVGLASALISAMGLAVSFSKLGLELGLVRFLKRHSEDPKAIINTVFTVGLLASVAAALIFIAGLDLWSPALLFIRETPLYLFAFVFFCAVSSLNNLSDHSFIASRRSGFVVASGLIFGILKVILAIALATFLTSFSIFASWGIGMTAAVIISIFVLLPIAQRGYRFAVTIKKKILGDMLGYSFANYISMLLWGTPALIFPLMVVNLLGAEANAYFYIGWAVSNVIVMIPQSVTTSLLAEGSYDETNLKTHILRSLKIIFLLLVPAVVAVLLLADKLLWLFGTQYSASATELVRIMTLAVLPLAVNILYLNIKRVQKDLKMIVGMPAFIAVISIVLALILLPQIGFNGVGIAWLAAHACCAVVIVVNWLWRWRKRNNEL